MPTPSISCLFGTQLWDVLRIVRRKACSQKPKEYHTKSNPISMQLSGAQGTHVISLRILVSWENLPQEEEHHKNRAMWIFHAYPSTILASFPQRPPHLLKHTHQLLPLQSLLWGSTVSLHYCKQRPNIEWAFCVIWGQRHFPRTLIFPNKKEKEGSPPVRIQSTLRCVQVPRPIPGICLASAQGRKRAWILETCPVRCTKCAGFQKWKHWYV